MNVSNKSVTDVTNSNFLVEAAFEQGERTGNDEEIEMLQLFLSTAFGLLSGEQKQRFYSNDVVRTCLKSARVVLPEVSIRDLGQAEPTRLVITVQHGAISGVLTDSHLPLEVAIIDYDVEADWKDEDMVSVPQTDGHPDVMAMGFLLHPTLLPERTLQLHRAVYRAGRNAHNTTEH